MSKQFLALFLAFALFLSGFSAPQLVAVFGRVVTDTNSNGIVDPSDAGIAGVTAKLYQNGQAVAGGFTNSSGDYELFVDGVGTFTLSTSLYTLPGSYTVVIGDVGGGGEFNFRKALTVFLPVIVGGNR